MTSLSYVRHTSLFGNHVVYCLAEFTWPDGNWIKGNYKQIGYYRVHYDEANWRELSKQLQDDHTVSNGNNIQQQYIALITSYTTFNPLFISWQVASASGETSGRENKHLSRRCCVVSHLLSYVFNCL